MENDDSNDYSVITFKQRTCYTNIDYREKLSLNAKDVSKLMILSANIDEQEEFITILIVLITIISIIQRDDTLDNHSDNDMLFGSISEIYFSSENSIDRSVFSGFTTSDNSSDSDISNMSDSDLSTSTVSSISTNEDDTDSSSNSISSKSTVSSNDGSSSGKDGF